MGKYREFWSLTEQALDFALAVVPGANKDAKPQLMSAYETLDYYGEVASVLKQLQANGAKQRSCRMDHRRCCKVLLIMQALPHCWTR